MLRKEQISQLCYSAASEIYGSAEKEIGKWVLA